ncbi:MAG: MurT ligase domain-containing protein [Rothia sp. (in: high G+C Gram-positive bacteria)]|uniref:MurT ligase domain-containing protein n=1 Tax=Rothia sp. (in: high G+C Gram-positive bacteria) TaxID=1885016 RepID=UPI0026FAB6E2|nr:MurT ligase domain-containing protein [Rothia sp. (in: high G+C Gram-positive bacteria)]
MVTMSRPVVRLVGQGIRYATKLRGGGSAFPGLVMEKLHPDFVAEELAKLPRGVVVVSGTNGKTTTTKMVVQLLEAQGLKVFTNRTGSNFVRGVAAALLGEMNLAGKLDADIAVLELDEAHAVHFVRKVKPNYALLLNVLRDQLDRFGEIDTTRRMLATVAGATTGTVVLNREDPRIRSLAENIQPGTQVSYFGLSEKLRSLFPSDDDLRTSPEGTDRADAGLLAPELPAASVLLKDFKGTDATFDLAGQELAGTINLYGVYNIFNAAAAMALTREVMGDALNETKLLAELEHIAPAFGRGETLTVNGQTLQLLLVKNPSGFRLSLASADAKDYATMITINDAYADGRDVSWLWDVDFHSLTQGGVTMVSGVRAYDMALRLQHDDVYVENINENLEEALATFIAKSDGRPMRIFCTYTAMLAIRKELAKITDVEEI